MSDRHPIAKRRRWRRALLWSGPAALGVLALLVLGALGLARSDPGRRWIADAVERAASTPGGIELTIERLDGRLPQEIRLTGVRLRDAQGVWLSAGSVALDWSPLALLSKRVEIAALRAGDVVLERLPETPEPEDAAPPGGLPTLPVEIAAERVSVEDLTLGEAILGRRGRFRIEGRAGAEDARGIATSLTVARSDGAPGRAELTALFRPHDNHLSLDAAIEEPAGGLIAGLSGLPDLPAVTARLEGDGMLDDWRGQMTLGLDGLADVRARIALVRDAVLGFEIEGMADIPAPARVLPPEAPEALVAGGLSFGLAGDLDPARQLRLARARVESAAARLSLSGDLALETLQLDAEVLAELLDPGLGEALSPGLRAAGLSLSAHVAGPALQPRIEARLQAAALSAPGLEARTLDTELTFAPARPLDRGPPEGAIGAQGTLAGLTLEGAEELAPLTDSGLRWRIDGRLAAGGERIEAEAATLEAGPARLTASGALDLRDERVEAAARLSLADMTVLAPWLGLAPRGQGEIDAWIESPDLGRTATAIVTGELREIALDEPVLHALLGGTSSLAADLTLAADGAVSARDITLDAPGAKLAGSLAAAAGFGRIEADYDLALGNLSVLAGPLGIELAGRARVRGRAEGDAANPRLSGQAALARARVEGIALDTLDLAFAAEDLAATPRGNLEARAATALGEVALTSDFVFADPELRLTKLRARSRGASLEGAVTVPVDGRPVSGTLSAETPDLAPWLALADLTGGGAARAEIRLAAEAAGQAATASARVTAPRLNLDDGRVLRGQSLEIEVAAGDLLGTPSGRADLRAGAVEIDDLGLDTLSLTLDGGLAEVAWRLAAEGAWRGPLALDAQGRLSAGAEAASLEVSALRGRALERDIALRAPVTLSRTSDTLALGPLDLRFGEATVEAQARLDPAEVSAKLAVAALPIASLDAVLPTAGVTGTMDARLTLDGPRADPSGDGEIRVRDIDMETILEGPILGLEATARWRAGRLSLAGALSGMPGEDARLSAELPLRLDPDGLAPVVPPGEPIAGQAAWQGDMASIWPLVPLEGHRLSGDAQVTLAVAGTLAEPRLTGAAALSGGGYENLEVGTLLRDLEVRIEFDDRRARLARLTAGDGAVGAISAEGEIAIDAEADYPFRLNANLTDFAAVRRDEVDATLDAQIALSGSARAALVAGQVETKLVEVRIVDTLPPEVVNLNVVETGAKAKGEALRAAPAKAEPAATVDLNLAVAMPRRVFVRGRGLDSEWAGYLKVSGSASAPKIVGEVKLVRGQLSLLAKTFRLVRGKVHFPPGAGAEPELDVVAEHKAGEVTAIARVTGRATNPALELSSVPELPQDEIVSTVLFGKKRGQLSALEAAQLAAAVAELSGVGGGAGLLDSARKAIGVDVLRVGGGDDDSGGASVEAGKYAAEGVYVGVKQGITDQSSAVAVEIEVTPNISVESETGVTGESDIGVKFKWDY